MSDFVGVTTPLYERLIHSHKHILIAGCTGSGKSTLLDALMNSIILEDLDKHKMVLIDMKMVELSKFEDTVHCMTCATDDASAERTLNGVMKMIRARFADMKERGLTQYDGSTVHLIIDELADLVLTNKKVVNLLQRICQLGRAANVQVICATQCPLASVIPTRIKVNFPIVIGMHTVTAQHSRNILDVNGCEELPMFGEALIRFPGYDVERVTIQKIPEDKLEQAILADRKEE